MFSIISDPNTGTFLLTNINSASGIYVYDLIGNVVFQNLNTQEGNLNIDISNHAQGIYYVKAVSQEGEILGIKKVVVQ